MYRIQIQRATRKAKAPSRQDLILWAKRAVSSKMPAAELTIRIVNENEMQALNFQYRKKDYATNVLSFPFEMPNDIEMDVPLLGDIVICAAVVNEEAKTQAKTNRAHWAHMVVHACLHLLGYDHENEADANLMEATEIEILKTLKFSNPYDQHPKGKMYV